MKIKVFTLKKIVFLGVGLADISYPVPVGSFIRSRNYIASYVYKVDHYLDNLDSHRIAFVSYSIVYYSTKKRHLYTINQPGGLEVGKEVFIEKNSVLATMVSSNVACETEKNLCKKCKYRLGCLL